LSELQGGFAVDFIERLTGLSPDGGNGTVEALYYVVLAAIVVMVVLRVRARRRHRER
jgi:hypothetical protein